MGDTRTIRLTNLRQLIKDAGGPTALARLLVEKRGGTIEMRKTRLSHVTADPPFKNIGHKFARELEDAMGKEHGWLDREYSSGSTEKIIDGAGPSWVKEITWTQAGDSEARMDSDTHTDTRPVYTSVSIGSRAFALRVKDDSMVDANGARSYPKGCTIIVDPDKAAKPGDRVIVRFANAKEASFKQLEDDGHKRWLRSLNRQIPAIEFPDDAVIVGVVVQTQIDE